MRLTHKPKPGSLLTHSAVLHRGWRAWRASERYRAWIRSTIGQAMRSTLWAILDDEDSEWAETCLLSDRSDPEPPIEGFTITRS